MCLFYRRTTKKFYDKKTFKLFFKGKEDYEFGNKELEASESICQNRKKTGRKAEDKRITIKV